MGGGAPAIWGEGAVDQHDLADAVGVTVGNGDGNAGADGFAHGRGLADADCVHHGDGGFAVVFEARLEVDGVGVAVAGIVHGDDLERRGEAGDEFQHQGGGLLIDVEQHDRGTLAGGAVMDVA